MDSLMNQKLDKIKEAKQSKVFHMIHPSIIIEK